TAALERQSASAEVLQVIGGSMADANPVFEKILDGCQRLLGATDLGVFLVERGERLNAAAWRGGFKDWAPASYPRPLAGTMSEMVIGHGAARQWPDLAAAPDVPDYIREVVRERGNFAVAVAPLVWQARGIGTLDVMRRPPRAYSDKELALLRTFADQAVIAIENARLFNEREARNRELAAALDQQTATSDIRRMTLRSPTDAQPVFDTIAQAALRLCDASIVNMLTFDGQLLRVGALAGIDPRGEAAARAVFPRPPARDTVAGMAVLTRDVFVIDDVLADPAYVFKAGADWGLRSALGLPLLRGGVPIGALAICRPRPGSFDEKLVALLRSFADQAVIALENERLFKELRDRTRELEIAGRHKSAFLANMSHELRTPLNAILGFTRIVLRESRALIAPRQAENLEKILASARHLVGLINATLDLTRIEAGRIEITASEIALAPLLDECLRSIEPLAADGVRLQASVAPDLPPLLVDAEKLHQIVLNLLGNAAKFTERGTIELRAAVREGAIAIEVEDTGIGIPPGKLDAVFEEFEQVDASHTRAHGGTGLGLAIARRLARAMGGDLTADSALGAGSTFTLTLPLRWRGSDEA
ncbi:MAG TPA: ATP-binding protein, partial [Burkholderiaceae bacterium]|nr:ATP-binding protein [Burkholderiaceae bacterium]